MTDLEFVRARLPAHLTAEPYSDYVAIKHPEGGGATIDFGTRFWAPGFCWPHYSPGRKGGVGVYMGRGYKDRIVADAVAMLDKVYGAPGGTIPHEGREPQ